MKRKLALASALTVGAILAFTLPIAAANGPTTVIGGASSFTQAAADLLYCALAGCTMTGGTTYSAVTTDITTGANEDLTVTPNGTGVVVAGKQVKISGVTTDITTPSGEDLAMEGGGSGVVKLNDQTDIVAQAASIERVLSFAVSDNSSTKCAVRNNTSGATIFDPTWACFQDTVSRTALTIAAIIKGGDDSGGVAILDFQVSRGTDLDNPNAAVVTRPLITFSNFTTNMVQMWSTYVKMIYKLSYTGVIAGGGWASTTGNIMTPTSSLSYCSCSSGSDCAFVVSETGAIDGQILNVVTSTAQTCTATQTAGQLLLAGAANYTMGQYDTLVLIYQSSPASAWIELSRSNN